MSLIFAVSHLLQSPNITLDIPTTRLENVAPVLSKAIGEPVVIGTPLLNDTITVSVKDVPKAEFMKKLAEAMNMTWSRKENFILLEQTSDQQRAERDYAEKEKFNMLSKAIEAAKTKAAKFVEFDSKEAASLKRELEALSKTRPMQSEDSYDANYYRRVARTNQRGPYSRFTKRLVTRLTTQMAMPLSARNRRVVYSSNPTGMQQRIPFKYDDLWAQLVNEQAVWSDTVKSTPFRSSMDNDGMMYYMGEAASQVEPASPTIPTIQIAFTTDATGMSTNVQLKIYNSKGISVTNSYESLMYDSDTEVGYDFDAAKAQKDKAAKIVLSKEAEEYRAFIKVRDTGKRPTLSPMLREQLLNPERFEPGAQYRLEMFKAIFGNRNFVVHNLSFWGDNLETMGLLTTPYFRNYLDINEGDKWVTLALKNRFSARSSILDPKLFGPMIRIASTKDCTTIEEESDFSSKMPENEMSDYQIQQRINLLRPYDLPISNDRASLRLFAFMDGQVKKAIFAGEKVPLQKLDQRFYAELYRAIYWADWSNWDFDYQAFQSKNGGYDSAFNELQNQVYGGILQEPTSMCPNGISPEMILSGSSSTNNILLAAPDESARYGGQRQLDPNYLGQLLFQQKNPAKYPWSNQAYDRFDRNSIRIVSQRQINFKVTVRKGIAKSFTLTEMHVQDPKVYSLDTLPEEIKKKIQEGYKQAEENDKYYQEYRGGRSGPPPPPVL